MALITGLRLLFYILLGLLLLLLSLHAKSKQRVHQSPQRFAAEIRATAHGSTPGSLLDGEESKGHAGGGGVMDKKMETTISVQGFGFEQQGKS